MGVAGDDDIEAERDWIDPQGLEIMQHEDQPVAEPDEFGAAYSLAQSPVSTFPLMAVTGAIRRSVGTIPGCLISPP
jgi:hypothetical protein